MKVIGASEWQGLTVLAYARRRRFAQVAIIAPSVPRDRFIVARGATMAVAASEPDR